MTEAAQFLSMILALHAEHIRQIITTYCYAPRKAKAGHCMLEAQWKWLPLTEENIHLENYYFSASQASIAISRDAHSGMHKPWSEKCGGGSTAAKVWAMYTHWQSLVSSPFLSRSEVGSNKEAPCTWPAGRSWLLWCKYTPVSKNNENNVKSPCSTKWTASPKTSIKSGQWPVKNFSHLSF